MNSPSHRAFFPAVQSSSAWKLVRQQAARPRKHSTSLEGVREELAVRDLLTRYSYAHDQCDIDGIIGCLAPDCVITNPRGIFSGSDAIRADFEQHFSVPTRRFHLWSNVLVRLSDDLRHGWMTSNFYAVLEAGAGSLHTVGGLAADEVVKEHDEWKLSARCADVDFVVPLGAIGEH